MTTHNIRRGSPVVVLIVGLMAMALSCGGSAAEAPDPQWAETTADSSSSDQSASGQGRLLGQGSAGAKGPAGAPGPSGDREVQGYNLRRRPPGPRPLPLRQRPWPLSHRPCPPLGNWKEPRCPTPR